jgi:hypothetical protein
LARAHAKAGDAAKIAGYLGSTDKFDNALAQYSEAYADQAERTSRRSSQPYVPGACRRSQQREPVWSSCYNEKSARHAVSMQDACGDGVERTVPPESKSNPSNASRLLPTNAQVFTKEDQSRVVGHSGSWGSHLPWSFDGKSLVPYRQCSARRVWRGAGLLERSIGDTAICGKPGEDLAGQLLYGDSLHCSNLALTSA